MSNPSQFGEIGSVVVKSTDNRGWSPEELAEMALEKIIYVGDETHPYIRDQAQAFKDNIRKILVLYMQQAANSQKTTFVAKLISAGYPEIAKLMQEMGD